jgi:type III secretory pathway component EscS
MSVGDPDLAFAIVLFVLLCIVGTLSILATRNHRETLRFELKLFVIAFALRFAMSIAIYQFGLLALLGDEDSSGWIGGIILQQRWLHREIGLLDLPSVLTGAFEGQHRGYAYLLGALFFITDAPARLPAAALNCFLGALTVVLVYRAAYFLFGRCVALRAGWLTCLFPSLIVWSAATLKEPVVIFLETAALYGCIRLKISGFALRHTLLCASAIVLLIPFRIYAAYIAGAAVVLSLAVPQIQRHRIRFGSGLAVLALLIPIFATSGLLVRHEVQFERANLEGFQTFRRGLARGQGTGSSVDSGYDLKTTGGLVLGSVDGAAHLLLAPFPWQLGGGSLRMSLTIPELAVWYFLFFWGVLPGLWYAARNRFNDIQPLLVLICGLGLLYSLLFGNIGLVYRQRAQLLPWLFIFAAVGLEQRTLRRLATGRAADPPALLVKAH